MSSPPPSGPRSTSATGSRCRSCGSRLRPEESWCSLCHTRVLSEAEKNESRWAPLLDQGDDQVDQPAARPEKSDLKAASKTTSGFAAAPSLEGLPAAERPDIDAETAEAADRLLAELAVAEAERVRESGFSALQNKLGAQGRGGTALIAGIGGAVLLVVGLLGLTLLGLLL